MRPLDEAVFRLAPPRLVLWQCEACRALHFPRRAVCATCGCDRLIQRLGGEAGRLFTFTIVRAAPPGYGGPVPYAIGVVELDDGLRVEANLHAPEFASLGVGQRVRAEAVPLDGETGIVSYRPA